MEANSDGVSSAPHSLSRRASEVLSAVQKKIASGTDGRPIATWLDERNSGTGICILFITSSYVSRQVVAAVYWDVSEKVADENELLSPELLAFELVSQYVEEPLGRGAQGMTIDRWGIGWLGTLKEETPHVPEWVWERLRNIY